MKAPVWLAMAVASIALGASGHDFNDVNPFNFDPHNTDMVASRWIKGIGCPVGEKINTGGGNTPFTDPACPTGDKGDRDNAGLLLVKTGPTANIAAAGAELKNVKGMTLTELGYDIRFGSHCGAGAPRFNIVTDDGATHFIGCSSPPPTSMTTGFGWERRRWMAGATGLMAFSTTGVLEPVTRPVKSITIIFDEGQDSSSASPGGGEELGSGLAVIDNVDVNGKVVGH
jgi:hypothetical protein